MYTEGRHEYAGRSVPPLWDWMKLATDKCKWVHIQTNIAASKSIPIPPHDPARRLAISHPFYITPSKRCKCYSNQCIYNNPPTAYLLLIEAIIQSTILAHQHQPSTRNVYSSVRVPSAATHGFRTYINLTGGAKSSLPFSSLNTSSSYKPACRSIPINTHIEQRHIVWNSISWSDLRAGILRICSAVVAVRFGWSTHFPFLRFQQPHLRARFCVDNGTKQFIIHYRSVSQPFDPPTDIQCLLCMGMQKKRTKWLLWILRFYSPRSTQVPLLEQWTCGILCKPSFNPHRNFPVPSQNHTHPWRIH